MNKRDIITIIENGDINNDLKVAYKFMLLSKGYTTEEIRILDNYDFFVREKQPCETNDNKTECQIEYVPLRNRRKKSMPKSLVCLTSTSEIYNKRDHTIYSLNDNEPVTKGRLVWSVINLYQKEYNPTYEEVSQLFNHKLNLLGKTIIDESSLDALRPDKQRVLLS